MRPALKPGPRPSCTCDACPKCHRRRAAARRYRGTIWSKAAAGRFKPSRLQLPDNRETLAYVAGIVDGEGCLTLQNKCWRIQVAMTDEPVIRWLGELGGVVKERSVVGRRQRCWLWLVMRQTEVSEVLIAIRPWLRVKAQQADRVIAEIRARDAARFASQEWATA